MSSDDESEEVDEQEKSTEKQDFPSSRQAKKVARLNQIIFQNEHKAQIRKVSKILKKKENDRTDEDKEILISSPDITNRLLKLKERRGTLKLRQLEIEDPKEVLEKKCKQLANVIRHSSRVVVYTGAGISTAASIPDYRGPNGVWTLLQKGQQPEPQDLCDATPTLTHMSIKKLHDEGHVSHVVSQNCDGLHLRSGLNRRKLSEVHGNMYIEICYNCKPHQEYIRLFDVTEKTGVRRHQTDRNCHTCKEPLKDTIVHFGEKGGMKCPYRWKEAAKAADKCDIILCLGTSLKILKKYSCLWCMDRKMKNRPKLYIVNLQWTPRDDAATMKINGRCDEVMEIIMKELKQSIPEYDDQEDPLFMYATALLEDEKDTTMKKVLEKPERKTISRRQSVECTVTSRKSLTESKNELESSSVNIKTEELAVKIEPNNCVTNNIVSPYQSSSILKSSIVNSQLLTEDFYRFNGLWSAPILYSHNPLPLPYLPQMLNNHQHAKFGEVSFQKYVSKSFVDKEVKVEIDLTKDEYSNAKESANNTKLESKQMSSHNEVKNRVIENSESRKNNKNPSRDCFDTVQNIKTSTSQLNSNSKTEVKKEDTSKNSSGRRTRKSFCPNCHGLSGKCPCSLLDSINRKKTPICTDCRQQPCTCAGCKNLSVCPVCRKLTDKCECHGNSKKINRCNSCRASIAECKCASPPDRPSLCKFCRMTPNKCICGINKQISALICHVCKQHRFMCKCVLNHNSSSSQGVSVPNFTNISSIARPPFMPCLDYANLAIPMNNILPFYMPHVFPNMNGFLQNNGTNGLLPGNALNNMLLTASTNGVLPSNNMSSVLSNKSLLGSSGLNKLITSPVPSCSIKVDQVLQDHSYLNKDQMQSLSPNCDRKIQRSQNKDKVDVNTKTGLKRSYSYVDDIQRSEDDVLFTAPLEKVNKNQTLTPKPKFELTSESSSPIIVDDDDDENDEGKDDESDNSKEAPEKPKLTRSMSVPGWFGKGLNLRKKRR